MSEENTMVTKYKAQKKAEYILGWAALYLLLWGVFSLFVGKEFGSVTAAIASTAWSIIFVTVEKQ